MGVLSEVRMSQTKALPRALTLDEAAHYLRLAGVTVERLLPRARPDPVPTD